MTLYDFIRSHRDELIESTRARVALRPAPRPTENELVNGVPLFLSQLEGILRLEEDGSGVTAADRLEMGRTATQHGGDLLEGGFSVAQVVHGYGDVCQAATELAGEFNVDIRPAEFRILNQCLDDAIANAVTEYERQRERHIANQEVERLGFFAHELRNDLYTALLSFYALKSGKVGIAGSTGAVLERSLKSLRHLIDRSLAEVRLASTGGGNVLERIRLAEFIEDLEIGAAMDAKDRGLQLTVGVIDPQIVIEVDRHLLASAVSNLLQNALKFTRSSGHVWLRAVSSGERVLIEVEDQCGGLADGKAEELSRPAAGRTSSRAGLGLGLAISHRAVHANGGKLYARNLPGRGCIFTVDLAFARGVPHRQDAVVQPID